MTTVSPFPTGCAYSVLQTLVNTKQVYAAPLTAGQRPLIQVIALPKHARLAMCDLQLSQRQLVLLPAMTDSRMPGPLRRPAIQAPPALLTEASFIERVSHAGGLAFRQEWEQVVQTAGTIDSPDQRAAAVALGPHKTHTHGIPYSREDHVGVRQYLMDNLLEALHQSDVPTLITSVDPALEQRVQTARLGSKVPLLASITKRRRGAPIHSRFLNAWCDVEQRPLVSPRSTGVQASGTVEGEFDGSIDEAPNYAAGQDKWVAAGGSDTDEVDGSALPPLMLSHSRMFDLAWCPWRYHLSVVSERAVTTNAPMAYGSGTLITPILYPFYLWPTSHHDDPLWPLPTMIAPSGPSLCLASLHIYSGPYWGGVLPEGYAIRSH